MDLLSFFKKEEPFDPEDTILEKEGKTMMVISRGQEKHAPIAIEHYLSKMIGEHYKEFTANYNYAAFYIDGHQLVDKSAPLAELVKDIETTMATYFSIIEGDVLSATTMAISKSIITIFGIHPRMDYDSPRMVGVLGNC